MKSHIEKLRAAKEDEEERQFQKLSFSPSISHSPRFKVHGTFQGRQQELYFSRDVVLRTDSNSG